jgi:uncharacterized protein YkwD
LARARSRTSRAAALIAAATVAATISAAPAASAQQGPIAHIAIIPHTHRVATVAARRHRRSTLHRRGACANARTPAIAATNAQLKSAVVCLVNLERGWHHLPRLHASRRLDRSAQRWTNAMVARRAFTHGADFSARITAVGFDWSAAAENIATGYPTPLAVVNGWIHSLGHCQNILSPMYLDVGTGISRHPVRGFASGAATWTQDFGLPVGRHAPSGNFGPASHCPY